MTPTENKTLVRDAMEQVLHQKRLSSVPEYFAPNYVYHVPGMEPIRGADNYRQFLASVFEAFPDMRHTIEDQIAEGDRVATRWTVTATHRGAFMGMAANGRKLTLEGMLFSRIVDGQVVEEWDCYDNVQLQQQLGAAPGGA